MTTHAVTGATGHLGRLAVELLLDLGTDPSDVVALVRDPGRAADLSMRGVDVRLGDYDRPETLPAALDGVDRLLLVSGSEVGHRVAQHTAVVEAAEGAGVGLLAYTSVLRADDTQLALAPEHAETEQVIRGSGVPFCFLRNGWYTENYTGQLEQYLDRGEVLGAAGDGRISAALRADYAAAAVAVLVGEGHEGRVYELGGPSFDLAELARTVTEVTGTAVRYRDLSPDDYVAALRNSGMPDGTASFLAGVDAAIARGELETGSDDLERLIGRVPTGLAAAVRAAR